MTFDERMAELGVDLSDLPRRYTFQQGVDAQFHAYETKEMMPSEYILHLTEIIDRMETRIVNLTGELNFIKYAFRDCATCTAGSVPYSDRCNSCDENFIHYEFAGVPEDWRPDDDLP